MMNRDVYWVWLQSALGYGANIEKVKNSLDAKKFYSQSSYEQGFFPRRREKLMDKDLSAAEKILTECEQSGFKVITYESAEYPKSFRELSNPPLVVYMSGEADLNDKVMIGIVGARKASKYSVNVVSQLSASLAKGGFTIVSGGALGVDSAAHTGAILAGGKTVAVLGCGLGYDYLKSNKNLRESISKNGALISEFPPLYPPGVSTFPIRNRLIASLSLGVVVAEASQRSGSLITAACASEQGRDIFAIPGGIYNESFQGVNKLLKDGAKAVYSVDDIVNEYYKKFPDRIDPDKAHNNDITFASDVYEAVKSVQVKKHEQSLDIDFSPDNYPENLSAKAQLVYDSMEFGEIQVNDICIKTSLPLNEVLSELTMLELEDYVESLPGKRYKQKR